MKALVERWTVLVRERFAPQVYLPMILVFTATNALFLCKAESKPWAWARFAAVFAMILSFFLRMRVFDEIKDYETDLVINPHRPLARGVASFRQVKRGLFIFICFELIIAWQLGFWPFMTHVLAIFYSLMMFEEFFLGDHLRPHLTTYALTHTFVSGLLGLSAAVAMTGMDLRNLHLYHLYFFLTNWAFFNLFEFARKTFAEEEERPNVESYSKIFGVWGAIMLSVSQAALGNWWLWKALQNPMLFHLSPRIWWTVAVFGIYLLCCLPFALNPKRPTAKTFRAASSFYLLLHYVVVLFIFWM